MLRVVLAVLLGAGVASLALLPEPGSLLALAFVAQGLPLAVTMAR